MLTASHRSGCGSAETAVPSTRDESARRSTKAAVVGSAQGRLVSCEPIGRRDGQHSTTPVGTWLMKGEPRSFASWLGR
jgi:hypothetical protein